MQPVVGFLPNTLAHRLVLSVAARAQRANLHTSSWRRCSLGTGNQVGTTATKRALDNASTSIATPTSASRAAPASTLSSSGSSSSSATSAQKATPLSTTINDQTMWTPTRQPPTPAQLLETNQQWIAETDPKLFETTAKGQKPSIFWLGCCDSRVPAELVTGASPGDLFVHRNIANTFSPKDTSSLAALAYAINNLGVENVVVCGHHGCGGVMAALASAKDRAADTSAVDEGTEAIQQWLGPIRALAVANLRTSSIHAAEVDPVKEMRHLVEQNVCAQVSNVANSSVVQNAWRTGKKVTVHGWVYDIGTGKIDDLKVSEGSELDK